MEELNKNLNEVFTEYKTNNSLHKILETIILKVNTLEKSRNGDLGMKDDSVLRRLNQVESKLDNLIFNLQGFSLRKPDDYLNTSHENVIKMDLPRNGLLSGSYVPRISQHAANRWKVAIRQIIAQIKTHNLWKKRIAGLGETRIRPNMSVVSRLDRMDDFLFKLQSSIENNYDVLSCFRKDVDQMAQQSDLKLVEEQVDNNGRNVSANFNTIGILKGEVLKEKKERVKGDKALQEYNKTVMEEKLEKITKKVWENLDVIKNVEGHVTKIANEVHDNGEIWAEKLAECQSELLKNQNSSVSDKPKTDWSVFFNYFKLLHLVLKKQFMHSRTNNNNNTSKTPLELKGKLEKIAKLIGQIVELGRMKNVDDIESNEGRNITKVLQQLTFTLHTLIQKNDESRLSDTHGHIIQRPNNNSGDVASNNVTSSWNNLKEIPFDGEDTTLDKGLEVILKKAQDLLIQRTNTDAIRIDVKKLRQVSEKSVMELKKQVEILIKLKDAVKQRAKQHVVEDSFSRIENQQGNLHHTVNQLEEKVTENLIKDEDRAKALQIDVQRIVSGNASLLRNLKENVNEKVEKEEVYKILGHYENNIKQLKAQEIPVLKLNVDQKANLKDLIELREELFTKIDEIRSQTNFNSEKPVLLGGRQYCLSCNQPQSNSDSDGAQPQLDNILSSSTAYTYIPIDGRSNQQEQSINNNNNNKKLKNDETQIIKTSIMKPIALNKAVVLPGVGIGESSTSRNGSSYKRRPRPSTAGGRIRQKETTVTTLKAGKNILLSSYGGNMMPVVTYKDKTSGNKTLGRAIIL